MKTIKTLLVFFFFSTMMISVQAQESKTNIYTYYSQRGAEDAKADISFTAKTKAEEKAFWKEQKAYEKELKRKNKEAYRVYIASKKEAYAAHYSHCDAHCHHDDYFYNNAGFYYYGYERRNYQTVPSRTSVNTQIGVGIPSVRLGL